MGHESFDLLAFVMTMLN